MLGLTIQAPSATPSRRQPGLSGLYRFEDIEPVVRTPGKDEHVGNRFIALGLFCPRLRG
jgi:hypothetical protein